MPVFKNETLRYIDHVCWLQSPTTEPQKSLIRFGPGEERALPFWLPYERLGLTLIDADWPTVPNTVLISKTFDFDRGVERRFEIEPCDTYVINVIAQQGRVVVYPGSGTQGVEVDRTLPVPFHFRAVFDWEYAPWLRVVGLDDEARATVHAEIDRDYPTVQRTRGGVVCR